MKFAKTAQHGERSFQVVITDLLGKESIFTVAQWTDFDCEVSDEPIP